MRDPTATGSVEQRVLDRVNFRLEHRFSNEAIAANVIPDYVLDAVVLELKKEVWEDRIAESTYTYRVPIPDTWFQHLRKSLGLTYRTRDLCGSVTLCKRVRFPDAPTNYPDQLGSPVLVETAAETWLEPRL